MAARQQLEQMRRQLPGGSGDADRRMIVGPGGQMILAPGAQFGHGEDEGGHGTGQYL